MRFLWRASVRDAATAVALLAARTGLKVAQSARRIARLGNAANTTPSAPDPAAEVRTLARMAERGVWRCETLAALHAHALAAIAQAEQDYAQVLTELARLRADRGEPPPAARQPRGDAVLAA